MLYYTESYYNHGNNYTWVVVFFASQLFGFLIIDMLIILMITLSVSVCCKNRKVCLARMMRESLYTHEDYMYIAEYSK